MFLNAILAGGARAKPFNLTGAWTLQTMSFVDDATGKSAEDFGAHPKDFAIYTPDGYMSVLINAEGFRPVASNASEQQAKLLATMTAHAGPFTFSNGVLVSNGPKFRRNIIFWIVVTILLVVIFTMAQPH